MTNSISHGSSTVEQGAHNATVAGSSPARVTNPSAEGLRAETYSVSAATHPRLSVLARAGGFSCGVAA